MTNKITLVFFLHRSIRILFPWSHRKASVAMRWKGWVTLYRCSITEDKCGISAVREQAPWLGCRHTCNASIILSIINSKAKIIEYYDGINNNATFLSLFVSCKNFAETVDCIFKWDTRHSTRSMQVYDFY